MILYLLSGIFWLVVISLIVSAIPAVTNLDIPFWPRTLIIAVLIAVVLFIVGRSELKKIEKRQEQARRAFEDKERRQQQVNQQIIRQILADIVLDALTTIRGLPGEVDQAEQGCIRAEREFADGAFAPFWDAVEDAVTHLARFDSGIQRIRTSRTSYDTKVGSLDSAPPPFTVDANALPNAIRSADRLRRIVREAQRDFQFSSIFEQRKTNRLLVSGFANLGEALRDVRYSLESSIEELSGTFSDSIGGLAMSNREDTQGVIKSVEALHGYLKSGN